MPQLRRHHGGEADLDGAFGIKGQTYTTQHIVWSPRNEFEIFLPTTAEEKLMPVFAGVAEAVIVCGHTHMQFDRTVGRHRIVNAGSIGMPFGPAGADWLLLGPGVELRHTDYDLAAAASVVRETGYPGADAFADEYILNPPSAQKMIAAFAAAELT